MTKSVRVLVIDGLTQNGLAICRSIGRAGHMVDVTGPDASGPMGRLRIAMRSRWVHAVHALPSAADMSAFGSALGELITREHYDYVMAAGTRAYNALSMLKERLSSVTTVLAADWSIVEPLHDKAAFSRLAAAHDLPIPRTYVIDTPADLDRAASELTGPVIGKLRNSFASKGLWTLPEGGDALRREYLRRYPSLAEGQPGPAIIQERLAGQVYDVTTLWHQGRQIAALTQLRLVTDWLDGGAGVVNITKEQPGILNQSKRFLEAIHWSGPLQLEWLEEKTTGCFYALEANPKFWGTTQLSISAGLDFPAWWVSLHEGETPDVPTYRRNLMYRWLAKELKTVLTKPADRHRLVAELKSWFRRFFYRPVMTDIVLNDIKPALYEWFALLFDLVFRGGLCRTIRTLGKSS